MQKKPHRTKLTFQPSKAQAFEFCKEFYPFHHFVVPLQEVEACVCASLIFCFTDREGTPERRKSKFAIRIYPFHHFVVPLPLQEVEAYSCALLIVIFTIRERIKSIFMSRDNPSTKRKAFGPPPFTQGRLTLVPHSFLLYHPREPLE